MNPSKHIAPKSAPRSNCRSFVPFPFTPFRVRVLRMTMRGRSGSGGGAANTWLPLDCDYFAFKLRVKCDYFKRRKLKSCADWEVRATAGWEAGGTLQAHGAAEYGTCAPAAFARVRAARSNASVSSASCQAAS